MTRSFTTPSLLAVALTLACASRPDASSTAAAEDPELDEASGPAARWSYEISVDDALEHMQLGLCIEGPRPPWLELDEDALSFVEGARVRGGPALARAGEHLVIETLGEHGCVDIEIDLDAATSASGRDSLRRGDTLLVAPDRWLWYPGGLELDAPVEARARFVLPEGVAATVPWPELGADQWRSLDPTTFGWNAWIVLGRYEPLEFQVGETEFEVAILDGARAASEAGIEQWLRTAAETSVELHAHFPRERVAVVVIPQAGWGDSPVLFGMTRRGGGGSVLLLLDSGARDDELPGEWVASHELLHLGMPLIAEPWMSEGFVTYYTQILRARQGVLEGSGGSDGLDEHERQIRLALGQLAAGFRRGRGGTRTLAKASADMRRTHAYSRVYWGGAAIALDLDVSLRTASAGRRSLDDLMALLAELAPRHRRWRAAQLLEMMDEEVARWREAGELDRPVSVVDIATRHLDARFIPGEVEDLSGLAVEIDSGHVGLLHDPSDEVRVRSGMFEARLPSNAHPP